MAIFDIKSSSGAIRRILYLDLILLIVRPKAQHGSTLNMKLNLHASKKPEIIFSAFQDPSSLLSMHHITMYHNMYRFSATAHRLDSCCISSKTGH